MPLRTIQVDMKHGQMDRNTLARQDSEPYRNGLVVAENWAPLPQGGVTRRPRFVRQDNALAVGAVRLLTWEFDEDERYLLAVAPTEITVHRIGLDLDVFKIATLDMTTFWVILTEQEIRELQFAVAYDTAILAHWNIRPVRIVRTGLETFVPSFFDFAFRANSGVPQAPTFRFTPSQILMQPCDQSGTEILDLKAGQENFVQWFGVDPSTGLAYDPANLELGSYLRYNGIPLEITAEADVNDRVKVKALLDMPQTRRVYVTYNAASSTVIWLRYETVVMAEDNGEGVLVNWGTWGTDDYLDIIVIRGEFETDGAAIVGSESGTTLKKKAAPPSAWFNMAPTPWWEESCWSNYRGWPGAVSFFQQRLWLGGSWDLPAFIASSKLQDPYNFDTGRGDDTDSIQAVIAESGVGRIKCLRQSRHLQIFTSHAEFYTGEDLYTPITPSSITIRAASNFGMGTTSPQAFAGKVYFVQRDDKMVRAHAWDDLAQQFNSPPIGFAHEDLLTDIRELNVGYGFGDKAAQYIYVVNDDGLLVVIFEIESANIRGFWPWISTDAILSTALIGPQLYVLKGGYIFLADYQQVSEEPSCMKTFPTVVDLSEGTSRGKYMRVGKVELDVRDCQGVYVQGQRQTEQFVSGSLNRQPVTGKLDFHRLGWERDPQLDIWVGADDPATILSILQEVSV